MIKVCLVVVITLWCGSLARCQVQTDPAKSNFPTKSEFNQILSEPATVEKLVDCITAVEFDRVNCDPRLEEAHSSATEYFRGTQTCHPPTCSKKESELINYFVKELSRKYPDLYRTMLDVIFRREENPDYVL